MDIKAKESHSFELTSRNNLSLSGVLDVHSFNEDGVLLETVLGFLTVGGKNLKITKLNLDQGEVAILGDIDGLFYDDDTASEKKSDSSSFLSRLFK